MGRRVDGLWRIRRDPEIRGISPLTSMRVDGDQDVRISECGFRLLANENARLL
jgi:hypothetical protein